MPWISFRRSKISGSQPIEGFGRIPEALLVFEGSNMPRPLTASDRSRLIRLAATMPAGDAMRKAVLSSLQASADSSGVPTQVLMALVNNSGEDLQVARRRFDLLEENFERVGLTSVLSALKGWNIGGPDRETLVRYFEAQGEQGPRFPRLRAAMGSATVSAFLAVAFSKLSQYDRKLEEKQPSFYRLGHYLEALGRVRQDVSSVLDESSPEALAQLKKSFAKHFVSLAPINATVKQIDLYLKTGKFPSLVR